MNSEFPVRPMLTRNLITLLVNLRFALSLFDTVYQTYFVTTHDHRKGGSDKGVTAIKLLRKFGLYKAHRMATDLEDIVERVTHLIVSGTDITQEELDAAWQCKVGMVNELSNQHDMKFILDGVMPRSFQDMLSEDIRQRLQDMLLYGANDEDTDVLPPK